MSFELPEGFEVVISEGLPKITLDRQGRFYFNAGFRQKFGLKPYDKIVVAYNAALRQLAVIQADIFGDSSNVYVVDKKGYASARRFCEEYRYDRDKAPYKFTYDRSLTDGGGAYVFTLEDAED